MKIVREHINEKFVEDSDPITDLGIGLNMEKIIKKILAEDLKHNMFNNPILGPGLINQFEVTGAPGKNQQHKVGKYLKIHIWGDPLYVTTANGSYKRLTNKQKGEYLEKIINDAGLGNIFLGFNFNPKTPEIYYFIINPSYKQYFKPGLYSGHK